MPKIKVVVKYLFSQLSSMTINIDILIIDLLFDAIIKKIYVFIQYEELHQCLM